MRNHQIIRLALPEGDEPPTEVRLFTAGEVRTEKGRFLFDEEAAALVLEGIERRKTELMFDYNHASLDPKPLDPERAARAAGWHDVELRNGELWAVNIRWTDAAAAGIRAKEWRYYSPAFIDDPKTGRIIDYINCALTNLPATHDLTPLVAASRARDCRAKKLSGPSFGEIASAIAAALEARFGELDVVDGPWIRDVYEDVVVYELRGRLWRIAYRMTEGGKAELIGDPVAVRHSYEPLEGNAMDEEKKDETVEAKLIKALEENAEKDKAIAKLQEQIEELQEKLAKLESKPEEMSEEGSDEERTETNNDDPSTTSDEKREEAQLIATARRITGRKNIVEVKGALLALAQSHDQVQKLSKRVAELEAQRANDEIVALVDEAVRAGKVTPAKRDEFIKLGRESRKALETTLSMLVPVVNSQPHEPKKVDASTIVLSREDEELIRKNGINREKFIEARRRQIERGLFTQ